MQCFGENGIIKKAQKAKELYDNSTIMESESMNKLLEEYDNVVEELPDKRPLVITITTTDHDTIVTKDDKGNQVVIPGGFKIASDSGTTVQQGIVIEDASQNQFVWIPVSNINHDGSNKIKLDDNSEVEITLGRYIFNTSTGVEAKIQYASEHEITTLAAVQAGTVKDYRAGDYYYELVNFRESTQAADTTGTNSTAKDLKGFINSVRDNKGYYLARYEASYASGTTFGVGNDSTYYKPASKVSTVCDGDEMNYQLGELWNFITQGNASKVSRQMYYGDSYVQSDLCNSYAWDTAIIYIQAMGNGNYANANRDTTGNISLKNTGETGDQKCKIFDMAGNSSEWTTEYSTYTTSYGSPCTFRGGYVYDSDLCASSRTVGDAATTNKYFSFRVLLYM